MALVVSDRIKETTTTTGTGTYTLGGAVTGFETFTANLSNGDTTYYACSDGTDFEVGLGTFTSSGTTLARTTILASSNSNAAVSWSSGTRTIFCTLPAAKAVFKDASGHVNFVDNEKAIFGTGGDLEIYHDGSNSIIKDNGTGNIEITGRTLIKNTNGETMADFIQNSRVDLYHDNSKKFETTSTGATVTGTLVADGISLGDNDIFKIGNTDDFQILHNGSQTALNNLVGNVIFRNYADDADIDIMSDDGSGGTTTYFKADGSTGEALLYHYGTEKFKTTSTGATVTGELKTTTLEIGGTDVTSTAAELNILDGVTATTSELNIMDGVTSTTAELNILDGVTATAAEINKLDGVTATTTELNYVDVTTLGTVEASKAVTAAANGDVTFVGAADNIQFDKSNNALEFKDSMKAVFGTGEDLVIQHNSGASIIKDNVGNPLYLQTDNTIHLTKNLNAETMAKFIADGAVELYHNNVKKLETTATGATVTGELVVDDLRMTTGANSLLKFTSNDGSQGYQLKANVSNTADFGLLIEDLDNNDIAKFLDGGECLLTHNHITRFQTTSTGATVTGDLTTTADIELGHASDTTIARASAGVVTIEGNTIITTGNSDTPTTTTSSADADFVLVDDGGTMKKITPANLGITSGSASKGFAVAMAIAL